MTDPSTADDQIDVAEERPLEDQLDIAAGELEEQGDEPDGAGDDGEGEEGDNRAASARREAARHRRRLQEVESERDALRATAETYRLLVETDPFDRDDPDSVGDRRR